MLALDNIVILCYIEWLYSGPTDLKEMVCDNLETEWQGNREREDAMRFTRVWFEGDMPSLTKAFAGSHDNKRFEDIGKKLVEDTASGAVYLDLSFDPLSGLQPADPSFRNDKGEEVAKVAAVTSVVYVEDESEFRVAGVYHLKGEGEADVVTCVVESSGSHGSKTRQAWSFRARSLGHLRKLYDQVRGGRLMPTLNYQAKQSGPSHEELVVAAEAGDARAAAVLGLNALDGHEESPSREDRIAWSMTVAAGRFGQAKLAAQRMLGERLAEIQDLAATAGAEATDGTAGLGSIEG